MNDSKPKAVLVESDKFYFKSFVDCNMAEAWIGDTFRIFAGKYGEDPLWGNAHDLKYKMINQKHHQGKIRFSSISERLSVIEVSYFEKFFTSCVELYKQDMGASQENFIRFNSTILALSTKLLNIRYQVKGGDAENYRQIKFKIGYGEIPEIVSFYPGQTHCSQNVSPKETITEQSKNDAERIKEFYRGITSRATYDLFTDININLFQPRFCSRNFLSPTVDFYSIVHCVAHFYYRI